MTQKGWAFSKKREKGPLFAVSLPEGNSMFYC